MKRTRFKQLAATALALAILQSAGTAFAQYVWTDERGVKQYSDMPPPPSVPQNRILKQPGGKPASQVPGVSEQPAAEPARTEMSTTDKNAEFRKRKAEQAEKEKKAAEEARLAAEKAKNCERARDYHRALESGERLSRTDKSGERTFLTDEQRQQELRDSQRVLQDCK